MAAQRSGMLEHESVTTGAGSRLAGFHMSLETNGF
jgi:hypothetical protein